MTKAPELYSLEQAAHALGVSIRTLTRRVKSGEIRHERDGKRVLIRASEVVRYRRASGGRARGTA